MPSTPAPRPTIGDRIAQFLFAALSVFAAGLVLLYRRPPLVDWPQHLAQDAIVARLAASSPWTAQYYETTGWFLPYQGFRWLHIALSVPLGNDMGGRVAWLAYVLGTPLAFAALLRRLGQDRWIAFGAFTLLVEGNFQWGFAPYCLAMTLAFSGLVLLMDYAEKGTIARGVFLALLGVAMFFTHAQPTALFVVSGGLMISAAWFSRAIPRAVALRSLALLAVPATIVVLYLVYSGWLDGSAVRGEHALRATIFWRPRTDTFWLVPMGAGLTTLGRTAWSVYLAAAAAVVAAFLLGKLPWLRRVFRPDDARDLSPHRWRNAGWPLAVLWPLLVFELPADMHGQTIAMRFASLALLGVFLLPLTPSTLERPGRWFAWIVRATLAACAFATLTSAHVYFARFDRSMRGFDSVLAQIPARSRVLTAAYSVYEHGYDLPVHVHTAAYLVAEREAMLSFGFVRTGVRYARTVPPDSLTVTRTWSFSHGGWAMDLDEFAPFYDYVLVRAGGRYPGSPFESNRTTSWRATRIAVADAYELWKIDTVRAYAGATRPSRDRHGPQLGFER